MDLGAMGVVIALKLVEGGKTSNGYWHLIAFLKFVDGRLSTCNFRKRTGDKHLIFIMIV